MEKSNIMIRLEKKEEQQKVENLVRESFWNVYRPGCLEHYVINQLRNDPAFVPELDFVMFLNENGKEGKLIGQNMFMRTSIRADSDRQASMVSDIMDCQREKMHHSFCVKNLYLVILMELLESMPHRKAIL